MRDDLRRLTADSLAAAGRAHAIHGLMEVDVTAARRGMRDWKAASGEGLSLTAFVVWCVARAVEEHPAAAAFRAGRGRLVAFEDADVCVIVERDYAGEAIGSPHVVRGANRRGLLEIHDAIRAAQRAPMEQSYARLMWLARAPSWLRRLWLRWTARAPRRWKALAGTVCVSAVGMFGAGAGWGVPFSQYPLMVTVGGLVRRPALVDGRLVERDCLCLTVTADHDVIDGAAAARFAGALRRRLEAELPDASALQERAEAMARP